MKLIIFREILMVTNTVNMSLPSFDRLPLSQIKREAARKNLKQKDVIVGISRQSVLKNLMTIKENQNGRLLCCVVKADAYGHGLANIVPLIDEQTDAYGITRNDDALKIRKMGITKPIIRLGEPSSEEIRDGIQRKLCIEEMVGSLNKAQEISFELTQAKSNKSMNIHISLNTGDIGRDGFECGRKYELLADFEKICEIENLDIKGIMTHFGYAESADQGVQHTKATQFIEISQWLRRIANKKGHFPLIHMTNTSSFTLVCCLPGSGNAPQAT
ncbi:MAG: alanine racemase [Gammaproteobacteria bacterium]